MKLNGFNYILFSTNKIKDSITSCGFCEYISLTRLAKIAFNDIALWPKKSDKPYEEKAWEKSLVVAKTVYDGKTIDITDGATYYHATYVNPSWAKKRTRTVKIDNHIFYKWD